MRSLYQPGGIPAGGKSCGKLFPDPVTCANRVEKPLSYLTLEDPSRLSLTARLMNSQERAHQSANAARKLTDEESVAKISNESGECSKHTSSVMMTLLAKLKRRESTRLAHLSRLHMR